MHLRRHRRFSCLALALTGGCVTDRDSNGAAPPEETRDTAEPDTAGPEATTDSAPDPLRWDVLAESSVGCTNSTNQCEGLEDLHTFLAWSQDELDAIVATELPGAFPISLLDFDGRTVAVSYLSCCPSASRRLVADDVVDGKSGMTQHLRGDGPKLAVDVLGRPYAIVSIESDVDNLESVLTLPSWW